MIPSPLWEYLTYSVSSQSFHREGLQNSSSSTSDLRLIKLENQVQCLMETHLAPKQPIQVNKITSLCEVCSGPYDTRYCMENPEQALVDYASSHTNDAGGKQFAMNQGPRSFNEAATELEGEANT
ncbi:hypothetical protein Tco_0539566 [Tanacetum coccineum]